jgi:hypothetical protein
MKRILFFALFVFLFCCSPKKIEKNQIVRLGVPVEALSLFDVQKDPFLENFRIITLKPEERVKNLEVLLFSTKSSAFDGIVVPARTAPVLKEWASFFPSEWKNEINKDVSSTFSSENGLYALPLNIDFPVFVYLKEYFDSLQEPKNLGYLRDDLRHLQRQGKTKGGLVSSVSEEILFLSLLSSERGVPPERFYDYHSIKLMEFFKEFDLSQIRIHQVESSLARGDSVAAFINLSECFYLSEKLKKQGLTLVVTSLPSTSKSFSIYNGFCLMGYNFDSGKIKILKHFIEKDFQKTFLQSGYAPIINIEKETIPFQNVIQNTNLIGFPFEWEGMNFLKESIRDVLIYGDDPETSLVRAEARLRNLDKK